MKRLIALNTMLLISWLPYSIRCWVLLSEDRGEWAAGAVLGMNGVTVWMALANFLLLGTLWYRPAQRSLLYLVIGLLLLYGSFALWMVGVAWHEQGHWWWDLGFMILSFSGIKWSIYLQRQLKLGPLF